MFLSIIIPLYKVERYVERCLSSCIEQDLSEDEYEIVVINDGSPDRSLEIASGILSERTNVKIIDQENRGLSIARNNGLKAAEGEYVWFVDSDDWIRRNCLNEIKDLISGSQCDILAICAADIINGKAVRKFSRAEGQVREGKDYIRRADIQVCAQFSIFRRAFLIDNYLSFYPEIYHEDAEFAPKTYWLAKSVISTDSVLYFMYPNPDSITRTPNFKKVEDIFNVVLQTQSDLYGIVDLDCRKGMNDIISSYFNYAMKNCRYLKKEDISKLNEIAYKNHVLLRHLRKASLLKYRISGWGYTLFPHHMAQAYKFMELFNPQAPSV